DVDVRGDGHAITGGDAHARVDEGGLVEGRLEREDRRVRPGRGEIARRAQDVAGGRAEEEAAFASLRPPVGGPEAATAYCVHRFTGSVRGFRRPGDHPMSEGGRPTRRRKAGAPRRYPSTGRGVALRGSSAGRLAPASIVPAGGGGPSSSMRKPFG